MDNNAVRVIDGFMHAQGHAESAADLGRLAQSELAEGAPGLATLAQAVAELGEALIGALSTQALATGLAAGIDLEDLPGSSET